MSDSDSLTHDDVTRAVQHDSVLTDPDPRLLGYLRVLCTREPAYEAHDLLTANRCTTINTILTQRFMARQEKRAARLTGVVIGLAVLALVVGVLNVIVAAIPIWQQLR